MAFEAPRHAMRLCQIHRRHMIDRTVATETTDAAIHVGRVIVINVIDGAIDPHPLHRVTVFQLARTGSSLDYLFAPAYGNSCRSGCSAHWMGRHFHKAVTITAIHSQLRDVDVMRKGHGWIGS